MKIRHIKALFFAVCFFTTVGAMSIDKGRMASNKMRFPADTALEIYDPDSLAFHEGNRYGCYFFEAVRQQALGNLEKSYDLLLKCIELNPKAAEAYYAMGQYYSGQQKDTLALSYFKKAASLQPDNEYYQERMAQYYIGTSNFDDAVEAYEKLYSANHDRTDVLPLLLQLYNQQRDYSNMLKILNRMEQKEGESEEITLSKMRVYELQGDGKAAYQTLKSLSEKHPNDLNYKVMLGNWLMQNNKRKEAYQLFIQAEKEEPHNVMVQSSLLDYYSAMGNLKKADGVRDKILLSKETPSKTKLILLRQLIDNNEKAGGDSLEVINIFDRMLEVDEKDTETAILKLGYMQLKHFPEEQIKQFAEKTLSITPDNSVVRTVLIQLYLKSENWDEVIGLSEAGTQYNPDNMAFYYFLGMSYFQKDDPDKCLDVFKRGISQINSESDPDLVSDFYAMMGDLLHQKGLREEAYAAYDSCLQWKPDNISCLNNYAYFISIDGGDLKKAESMSRQTVDADPNNSTYLDTYAWILFLQKRYADATIYIDRAVKNDTDSTAGYVILEHAGDIFSMNGDMEKALAYWNKALKTAKPEDKAIIKRKIKHKKYIGK